MLATTVYCPRCQATHAARLQRESGRILGRVDCPHQPPPVELSDDADLFLHLRSLDLGNTAQDARGSDRVPRGQIYITESCDWSCPVCYASSGPRDATSHLPLPEILRRVVAARQRGMRRLLLVGGEPTQHPGVLEIITKTRRLGIAVSLVTNGEKVGKDPDFARYLKRAGLGHLNLQFDSLQTETLRRMRGRADLETKRSAIRHTVAAGLPYSFTTTLTEANVSEVGALVRWAGEQPVMPSLVLFQSMVRRGRFPDALRSVSREAAINSLLGSRAIEGAGRSHLHSVPRVPPQLLPIHPDCGTLLFVLRQGNRLVPVDEVFDIAGFRRAVIADGGMGRTWLRWAMSFLRHLRHGHRIEILRGLYDLRPGRPNRRLMVIGFTSFCSPEFLDCQRISRCGNHVLLASGAESICGHFCGRQPPTSSPLRTSP